MIHMSAHAPKSHLRQLHLEAHGAADVLQHHRVGAVDELRFCSCAMVCPEYDVALVFPKAKVAICDGLRIAIGVANGQGAGCVETDALDLLFRRFAIPQDVFTGFPNAGPNCAAFSDPLLDDDRQARTFSGRLLEDVGIAVISPSRCSIGRFGKDCVDYIRAMSPSH